MSSLIDKNWTVTFRSAFIFQLIVLGFAITPAFLMLYVWQCSVSTMPDPVSFYDYAENSVKAILSAILMIGCVALYADVAFPLVMVCFGKVFSTISVTPAAQKK